MARKVEFIKDINDQKDLYFTHKYSYELDHQWQILNEWLGEYITSYHDYLLLEGPIAEPILSQIISSGWLVRSLQGKWIQKWRNCKVHFL
ncbi:hypothetical protein TSUD_175840 [Trifolium subterraneum]|uniref:Uncharacterized protein n=1 Tax=Trifolium subterraneum TaxID=3900 RepID=A0A2Z6LKD6_TRISU|nr:hypothetical protein TSUD_175840 [Trifolium subterraneum]